MGKNKKSKMEEYHQFGKSLVETIRANKDDYKQKTMEKMLAATSNTPNELKKTPILINTQNFWIEKMQSILDKKNENKQK